MTWVDQTGAFGFGTQLTSTQMQNLRDNMSAMAAADSGSPVIKKHDGTFVQYGELTLASTNSGSVSTATTVALTDISSVYTIGILTANAGGIGVLGADASGKSVMTGSKVNSWPSFPTAPGSGYILFAFYNSGAATTLDIKYAVWGS